MCVDSHENVHNDEQSTTIANNAIDVMAEKIDSNTRNRTNVYQIDSDMVTSTSSLMEAYDSKSTTTNQMEREEPECRTNGASV